MAKRTKGILTAVFICCLVVSSLAFTVNISAASKKYVNSLKVSHKNVSLKTGESTRITYQVKTKGTASKKVNVKTSSSIVGVTVKTNQIVLKGKKSGTVKLTVTTKAKNKAGKRLQTMVKITIKNKQVKKDQVATKTMGTSKAVAGNVKYVSISKGIYKISTKLKSNMVLDVVANSSKNGTNIQIYQDNKSTAQQFVVTHMGNGWHKICHLSSDKALDVTGASKKPGSNVQLYTYNGSDAQLWRFYPVNNGYYQIQNKLGCYLDVDGGKKVNNTNVQVYQGNTSDAQRWKLIPIIYPQKISVSSATLTSIGASKKLSVTYNPSNATEKGVTWTSSNNKVAVVSNGTVKAVGSGTTTITARTSNGKTASAKVTVKDGAATIAEGYYNINTGLKADMMLDAAGGGTSDGTNIQIHQKNASAAQKFKIESAGYGWYVISNTFPRECLDVNGGSKKSGTNVQLYRYNGSDAQLWRFYALGNGYYTLMNKLGCYLDVDGGIARNNRNVLVFGKNGTKAQKWKLIKTTMDYLNLADSLYTFCSKVGNNFVMDVDGGKITDGANIQIYKSNDSTAQKFNVQPTGDGWFKISNPLSGKCLDVNGGSNKSGTNVQLYGYNGTDAQKWRLYPSGDGNYYLKNKLGCYLDVDGGIAQNNRNVLVYKGNGSNAQKWIVKETSAILLKPNSLTLDGAGKTQKISVFYEPARVFATNKKITWSSSNQKVAAVTNGEIKAVGAGSATITAKAFNGKKATVTVVVNTTGVNYTQTQKQITNNGQVVDIFNGVASQYITGVGNSNTGTYCCAMYVDKYYRTVYGVSVSNMFRDCTPIASKGHFYITSVPREGDVGYQLNSSGSGGHWFIIKAVNNDGTYTVIEQNWKWQQGGKTYCTVNRRVSYSATKGFKVFRWSK